MLTELKIVKPKKMLLKDRKNYSPAKTQAKVGDSRWHIYILWSTYLFSTKEAIAHIDTK